MEFSIPQNVRSEYIRKDLLNRFSLKQDTSVTMTRIYYDSFDWRLFRKKLQLFSQSDADGKKLIFSPFNQLDKQRTLNLKEIPTFVSDIDSFIFQQKLTPILDVRALLPQLKIQSKVKRLRYVNKDNKTCLYIFIENPRVVLADNHYRLLGKRISLVPVKGYTKTFEQISKFLVKTYKPIVAGKDQISLGLEFLSNGPDAYFSRLKLNLNAEMTTSGALRHIFLTLLEIMEINEDGIINDIDSEFLHDFRVAVRKTRSLLSQLKHVFPINIVEVYADEFGRLGTITGPARDMHVYLHKFDSYQQSLPEELRPQLEPLRDFLIRKNKREHKELVAFLRSPDYIKLKQSWRAFLTAPLGSSKTEYNAEKPLKQVADKQIWKLYRRILKEGDNISANSADEELHKLRISGKKLRYLLEFYENLYTHAKIKRLIGSMKQLQNMLGDFHDYSVQIEALRHYEQQMSDEAVLSEQTRQAIDLLMDLLHSQQLEIRQHFNESFIAFSDKQNQLMFKSLFKSDATAGKAKKQTVSTASKN